VGSKRATAFIGWIVIACLVVANPAAAQSGLKDQDIWCLSAANRAQVASTAALLELGQPSGPTRALITPTGSKTSLTLKRWRVEQPKAFDEACTKAFETFGGGAAELVPLERSIAKLEPHGLSNGTTTEISAGGGIVGVLLGIGAGYWVGKLTRKDERGFAEALARASELILLNTEVNQLVAKQRSETATPDDYLRARALADGLSGNIPRKARGGSEALKALERLLTTLGLPDLENKPDATADRLHNAAEEARCKVEAVVAQLHKDVHTQ